ncbi:MAG: hypothetical protein U9R50_04465 [Campylobacterota bacterium]|nr:hypothetical protein [Campylobacterota bacterium]
MKYVLIMGLFFNELFAHGGSGEHIHFFGSLHVEGFILFLAGFITTYFIYIHATRGDS